MGRFEDACEVYKSYAHINDSIRSAELDEQLSKYTVQFEVDKLEHDKLELRAEVNRNLFITSVIVGCLVLILLIVITFYYMRSLSLNRKLDAANKAVIKASHMKSSFIQHITHEIRTPLNSIVGFASIIAELDDREERQEYLAIMQENTELLLQLISDILDLAKIEAGTLDYNMGYVDVSDFCKDVMRNYDIKEDKAVPVLLAPDLPDYRIYTDKKRLMQVVTNFINNALKFTSEGQILLEYHPVEGTGQIEFSVTDTGMGIALDAVATVFDRFVKLNTFAKGTGLGLSICKSIIEHLGGTIGAESELGVGSRFWFRHPCAE